MTMQLPLSAFDVAEAHPLKRARRLAAPAQGRAWAAVITLVAHIVAVTAIVEGLRQANVFHAPELVSVQITPHKIKPEELPPPMVPTLIKPSVMTAPMPIFDIERPAEPMVAVAPPPPVAPAPGTQQTAPKGAVTWQGLLLARLEQAKRYPASAQARRQQGVVLLHFTMDRNGTVLSAAIQKSSGYEALDQESLAMLQRAQPLPQPPVEVTGDPIELVVPVEFYLNRRR